MWQIGIGNFNRAVNFGGANKIILDRKLLLLRKKLRKGNEDYFNTINLILGVFEVLLP